MEWFSAAVLVLLLAAFMWRSGASAGQTVLIVGLAILGILATAFFWDFVGGGDG